TLGDPKSLRDFSDSSTHILQKSSEKYLRIVPVILQHLTDNSPPVGSHPESENHLRQIIPKCDLINNCVRSLCSALSITESNDTFDIEFSTLCAAKWPTIRNWFHFLMTEVIGPNIPFNGLCRNGDYIYSCMAAFLKRFTASCLYSSSGRGRDIKAEALASMPGFLEFLARMWLHGSRRDVRKLNQPGTFLSLVIEDLSHFIIQPKYPVFVQTLLDIPASTAICLDGLMLAAG
ncbi:hypothetical protein C8J56DRAFT_989433, partial [Mycena floridula]